MKFERSIELILCSPIASNVSISFIHLNWSLRKNQFVRDLICSLYSHANANNNERKSFKIFDCQPSSTKMVESQNVGTVERTKQSKKLNIFK